MTCDCTHGLQGTTIIIGFTPLFLVKSKHSVRCQYNIEHCKTVLTSTHWPTVTLVPAESRAQPTTAQQHITHSAGLSSSRYSILYHDNNDKQEQRQVQQMTTTASNDRPRTKLQVDTVVGHIFDVQPPCLLTCPRCVVLLFLLCLEVFGPSSWCQLVVSSLVCRRVL